MAATELGGWTDDVNIPVGGHEASLAGHRGASDGRIFSADIRRQGISPGLSFHELLCVPLTGRKAFRRRRPDDCFSPQAGLLLNCIVAGLLTLTLTYCYECYIFTTRSRSSSPSPAYVHPPAHPLTSIHTLTRLRLRSRTLALPRASTHHAPRNEIFLSSLICSHRSGGDCSGAAYTNGTEQHPSGYKIRPVNAERCQSSGGDGSAQDIGHWEFSTR